MTQPSSQVLMAELNKIKAEKARDEAEKEAGRREEEEQIRMENILSGCNSKSTNFSGLFYLVIILCFRRKSSVEGEVL